MPLPVVSASPLCEVDFQTTFTPSAHLYRRLPSLSAIYIQCTCLIRSSMMRFVSPARLSFPCALFPGLEWVPQFSSFSFLCIFFLLNFLLFGYH